MITLALTLAAAASVVASLAAVATSLAARAARREHARELMLERAAHKEREDALFERLLKLADRNLYLTDGGAFDARERAERARTPSGVEPDDVPELASGRWFRRGIVPDPESYGDLDDLSQQLNAVYAGGAAFPDDDRHEQPTLDDLT